MKRFTHLDALGRAQMVDVTEKAETRREAVARGRVLCRKETLERIQEGSLPKGDVVASARIAGILAAKRVPDLLPLCHPLPLSGVEVHFAPGEEGITIESRVKVTGRTGAEMEALTAVAVAALTIYDMCKAVDAEMVIDRIRLVAKSGGKSGRWVRAGEETPISSTSSLTL